VALEGPSNVTTSDAGEHCWGKITRVGVSCASSEVIGVRTAVLKGKNT